MCSEARRVLARKLNLTDPESNDSKEEREGKWGQVSGGLGARPGFSLKDTRRSSERRVWLYSAVLSTDRWQPCVLHRPWIGDLNQHSQAEITGMDPECVLNLGKSHGNFMACQTQMIITVTVIIIINSIAFIIIDPLDEKILQQQAPVLPNSLPALSLLHEQTPGDSSTKILPR